MNKSFCCFAGHKNKGGNEIKEKIKTIAERLITENNVSFFQVGNYGEFDKAAASAIRELKEKYPHIILELVLPYLTKGIEIRREWYYKKYDSIIIADIPENTPKKYMIVKANEYMVDNADYLICCITHTHSGAYKTYEYAKKKEITIFNISDHYLF